MVDPQLQRPLPLDQREGLRLRSRPAGLADLTEEELAEIVAMVATEV
jgi:hypothetical protein